LIGRYQDMQTINIRQEQGQLIAETKESIKRINEKEYFVNSQSGNGSYRIFATELGWNCSCPDHKFRGVKCKHVYAVEFSLILREKVKEEIIIQPITSLVCRYCNSENIVKKAIRKNKYGNIQRY
jgi:putative transposase